MRARLRRANATGTNGVCRLRKDQVFVITESGTPASSLSPRVYADQPNRSPWIAQLAPDGPPQPLGADMSADVVVVGAGIAGVATAFFVLRSTTRNVLLVERDRVARGATARNAGQLT